MGRTSRLSARDFDVLWTLVHELHGVLDTEALVQFVLVQLPALIPSEITTFDEMCPSKGASRHWVAPASAVPLSLMPVWEHVMHDHPVLNHMLRTGDTTARKISDLVSHAAFRTSPFFNEWYRRIGVEYALNTSVAASVPQGIVVGLGFHRRGMDFSERDRAVLNLLRPHLVQAYQNSLVICGLTSVIDHRNGSAVVLGRDGHMLAATAQARDQLAAYFPTDNASGGRLPDRLDAWIQVQLKVFGSKDRLPAPRTRFEVERPGRRLVVDLLESAAGPVLQLTEERHSIPVDTLAEWSLTDRESEVLGWLVEAKTNGEIASILSVRPRTVDKHCERVYQKLGVENRTAAVRKVLDGTPGIIRPLRPTHVTAGPGET